MYVARNVGARKTVSLCDNDKVGSKLVVHPARIDVHMSLVPALTRKHMSRILRYWTYREITAFLKDIPRPRLWKYAFWCQSMREGRGGKGRKSVGVYITPLGRALR